MDFREKLLILNVVFIQLYVELYVSDVFLLNFVLKHKIYVWTSEESYDLRHVLNLDTLTCELIIKLINHKIQDNEKKKK